MKTQVYHSLFEVVPNLKCPRTTTSNINFDYHQSLKPSTNSPIDWEVLWEFESSGGSVSEYPGASRFVSAATGNYTKWKQKTSRPIRRIVIHITDGNPDIKGPISWFQNPKATVSAHYIVGRDGEVVQMVRENDIAHHAAGANRDTVGIEHVANTKGLMPTSDQYRSSAALVRWLCQKYNLPLDRRHILGHSEANPKTKHKGCPNAVWDWNYFMQLVTGVKPGGLTPKKTPNDSWKPSTSSPKGQSRTTIDIDYAIRRNEFHKINLNWLPYVDLIVRLLGFTAQTPNEETFAKAIARWQSQQKGLVVDGILGPKTWERMKKDPKFKILEGSKLPGDFVRQDRIDSTRSLVYEEMVKHNKDAFLRKVREISAKLSINPNWLMALMKHESGIDPQRQNPKTKATGLIQFMPKTAIGLGTTVEALQKMSNVQQLDWVLKYYLPKKGKFRSYFDLHLFTFYPRAMGEPDNFIFGGEKSMDRARQIARANPRMDLNQDGVITMKEFKQRIHNIHPSQIRSRF
jgi:hypothetical protein